MSNNKDFKVKNGIKPTVYQEAVGTVVSGSVGYSLAGASYDSKSLSTQAVSIQQIHFKPDGLTAYSIHSSTDTAYQYTLSTAWDISTGTYASKSFSFAAQDSDPAGIQFKPDGTKVYITGFTSLSVYQYSLSTAWDISTASYDSVSFSVASQDTPRNIFFKPDGTKMYVVGNATDAVYQYSLGTAWDISSASYDSISFSVATQETTPTGLYFKPDGTQMYTVGYTNDSVHLYNLGTAWDVSTASYSNISFNVSAQDAFPFTVTFDDSGTKMYVAGQSSNNIYQYSTVQTTNTLDLSTGNVFEITPTSDIQVTLSNPAASGTSSGATLLLSAVGTEYTITYDTSIEWPGGTAPTSPAIGETDILAFSTSDGGTSYKGVLAIDGAK
jgi:DNA-binding beta-propeller fold protein YncE